MNGLIKFLASILKHIIKNLKIINLFINFIILNLV